MLKDKLNLQLFAEEQEETEEETQEETEKTFTQDDVDSIITKRLEREQKKWEKNLTEKIEKERKEAERLAKLSAEEKEKEVLEKTKKEIEKTKNNLKKRELLLDAKDVLSDKALPVNFAERLLGEDAESTMDNIKAFEEEWQKAIEKAVNDKLKGTTPKSGEKKEDEDPFLKAFRGRQY